MVSSSVGTSGSYYVSCSSVISVPSYWGDSGITYSSLYSAGSIGITSSGGGFYVSLSLSFSISFYVSSELAGGYSSYSALGLFSST